MPLYVMSALMLLAAHASGLICDRERCGKSWTIGACVFIASVLFLGRFELIFSPELILCASSVLFVFASVLSYAIKRNGAHQTLKTVLLGMALSIPFHLLDSVLERDASMLASGLIAVCANIVLRGKGRSILLVCALSELMFQTEKTLLLYLNTGYCCFELASYSLDRMMIMALFTGFAHGILNWSSGAISAKNNYSSTA